MPKDQAHKPIVSFPLSDIETINGYQYPCWVIPMTCRFEFEKYTLASDIEDKSGYLDSAVGEYKYSFFRITEESFGNSNSPSELSQVISYATLPFSCY